MSMFCYQCQETAGNTGCSKQQGVCGKKDTTAVLMDLLIYTLKGIAIVVEESGMNEKRVIEAGRFIIKAMFKTITNGNFDEKVIAETAEEALKLREKLKEETGYINDILDCVSFNVSGIKKMIKKGEEVGVLSTEKEDVRSLRELLIYGLKGISAYAEHARVLGYEDIRIYSMLIKGLASTVRELSAQAMIALVLDAGEAAVVTMELLDKANTETFGTPEITKVNIGTGKNPGILVSGHDLKDIQELLQQAEGAGIDIYTHGEMLPANYYPKLKKYKNLVGNYGNSWWKQDKEFASFNGPILMTTNCIIPVKDEYKKRIFTTGEAGYPGIKHIPDREEGGKKDFSQIIKLAKKSKPPQEIETGTITGGFAHSQVLALSDKIIDAVKSGAIKRFVVMAGCDGRQRSRSYFTEVAEKLPSDTVILTAGCAKYRYNKLNMGEISGIPRVLDAGQCNDSYSLVVIALKLKEAFGLNDINKLPISFDIAWYEQKAVAVLLALLYAGVKGLRLGPTLPGFLSPAVVKTLVSNFGIKLIDNPANDVAMMMEGR